MPLKNSGVLQAPPVTVLFVHSGSDWIRGSEQCLLDLVAHLDRTRFTPVVICNREILASAARNFGAEALVIPDLEGTTVMPPRARVQQLRTAAGRLGADIIHANSALVVPAMVHVARAMQLPLVAHLHITPNAPDRRHQLLHQASMVVGVSKLAVAGFVEEGMRADTVRVIDNAVDGARILAGDATALRAELGIAPDSVVTATLGSLIDRKGHDTAIKAVAIARTLDATVDLHLLVCGSGEDETLLRALASDKGIEDRVHFLGFRSDAGAVLRDAVDLFLAPSRWEALPLNVLEAQWIGLPVIASDIPAHHESLISDTSSEIVPLDDADALARAINKFAHTNRYAKAARDIVQPVARDRFSMSRHVNAFEDVYETLLRVPAAKYGWFSATSWPKVYTDWLRDIVRKRVSRTLNRRVDR